jgi:hypothetical protein
VADYLEHLQEQVRRAQRSRRERGGGRPAHPPRGTECQGRMQSRKRRREEGRRRRSLVLQRELLHCADAMSYMDWDVCHGACRFVLRRDAKRGAEDELADLKRNSGR